MRCCHFVYCSRPLKESVECVLSLRFANHHPAITIEDMKLAVAGLSRSRTVIPSGMMCGLVLGLAVRKAPVRVLAYRGAPYRSSAYCLTLRMGSNIPSRLSFDAEAEQGHRSSLSARARAV